MKLLYITTIFTLTMCGSAFAQELVYRPKNPAFGGDTFNYQWLLSSAEAQNKFTDGDDGADDRSDLERFTENLKS